MINKIIGRSAALLIWLVLAAGCSQDARKTAPDDEDIHAARQAAKALGATLKSRLFSAISEGGPVAGVSICSEAAPEIAEQVSQETGMSIGRTALRVRNPANAPDAWEREQLQSFQAAVEDGADPVALEYAEIVNVDGGATLRWMKPIMMDGLCVACHGEVVSPDVIAAIAANYPGDEATGFKYGELRGAFTISKPVTTRNDALNEM